MQPATWFCACRARAQLTGPRCRLGSARQRRDARLQVGSALSAASRPAATAQPPGRGLAGRRLRERRVVQPTAARHLPAPGRQARTADCALGLRHANERPNHADHATGVGRGAHTQPSCCQQRQPRRGEPVQDAEVLARRSRNQNSKQLDLHPRSDNYLDNFREWQPRPVFLRCQRLGSAHRTPRPQRHRRRRRIQPPRATPRRLRQFRPQLPLRCAGG